jgi:pyridoxamine 5'-phosphate oxidase
MSSAIADLRRSYTLQALSEAAIDPDPIHQFRMWFDQAVQAQLLEPNAMTLATARANGTPSARMVLLKEVDQQGFVFFTNYDSRKGQELADNPKAALVFWWAELERQVRIEGSVSKISVEETQAYFWSRPVGSQLGAWVSQQSQPIPNRQVLEDKLRELTEQYQDQKIPCPEHWGGYRVAPEAIEFWQGRPNRLHDRILYQRLGTGGWKIIRLSP